ncbi:helix-turn-helix transcriptional regulator [Lactococcus lactis]|uniref:Transcriptional regulator with XRE-family HTH domain n=1 Tax=Lactococcus lactis TaxID=1358 RepID=A0AAW5TNY2_9LACT|nr:helix-turn-helix transcriptional regulator [Lactococcus lactis]MCW2280448.1 transcriptional regulator with XRE-family HTH domain [Lactococcus lactis]
MKNTLKKHREKLKMTQQEVVKRAGVSLRAYQNYEQQLRTPDVYQAKKIAKILKTDINKLFP